MSDNHVEMINGARTSFGPRFAESRLATNVRTAGALKHLVIPVKFDALPEHITGDETGAFLPARALVTRVIVSPSAVDFAGGTSYEVKVVEDDGTDIVAIVDAITLAQMNSGAVVEADESLITDGPAYVEVTATGTFTAGEGSIVIEYMEAIDLV